MAVKKGWKPQRGSLVTIQQVNEILADYDGPMTLRQVYYQLVAVYGEPNTERRYKRLSQVLTKARVNGYVDGTRIVDRTRQVKEPYGYTNLQRYLKVMRDAYARRRAEGQPHYIEVWVEKDALAGVLEDVAKEFGVPLCVCRGYPSYSAIRDAMVRLTEWTKAQWAQDVKPTWADMHILYLGDFDPSGEDIPRSIGANLREWFDYSPRVDIIALTEEQVEEYDLPPAPAKRTDARAEGFVERHGDVSVELDALRPDVLQELVKDGIRNWWDDDVAEALAETEAGEIERLQTMVDRMEEGEE